MRAWRGSAPGREGVLPSLPDVLPGNRSTGARRSGGEGSVYPSSRDPAPGSMNRTPVALKLVSPAVMNPQTAERLRREARVVARLDHPSIVPVHDIGEHEGAPFFVMPVVLGTTLRQRMKTGDPEAAGRARGRQPGGARAALQPPARRPAQRRQAREPHARARCTPTSRSRTTVPEMYTIEYLCSFESEFSPWSASQRALARPPGLEPGTVGLENRCSIRLSYGRSDGASIAACGGTRSRRRKGRSERRAARSGEQGGRGDGI